MPSAIASASTRRGLACTSHSLGRLRPIDGRGSVHLHSHVPAAGLYVRKRMIRVHLMPNTRRAADIAFLRRVFLVVAVGALVAAIWALSDIFLLLFGAILFSLILHSIA